MNIYEAGQVLPGDVILDPITGRDVDVETVRRSRAAVDLTGRNRADGSHLVLMFPPGFRLVVLKRPEPTETAEARTAELKKLARDFLNYAEIDDGDTSTDFLMDMSRVAHRLWEALGREYPPGVCGVCRVEHAERARREAAEYEWNPALSDAPGG